MDTQELLLLAQFVLPTDILSRFEIIKIESDETITNDQDIESKGFTSAVTVHDFPIRDKGVDLVVRRRRWYNKATNTSFTTSHKDLQADGVRYSKEFAAFLLYPSRA